MKKTHVLILMILSSTASSLYTQRIYNRKPIIKIVPSERRTAPEPTIMSIRELQTFLNEQDDPWGRYKCGIDGKMGKETLTAWDNYICDRQAIKEFK